MTQSEVEHPATRRSADVRTAPGHDSIEPGSIAAVPRMSRAYVASLLSARTFYAALRDGGSPSPRRVVRAAQQLVDVAERDIRPLLWFVALHPGSASEPAAICAATAIVGLSIARQLTADRRALLSLAAAALLFDAGRARIAGSGRGVAQRFDEDESTQLPASAAVVLTSLGGFHESAAARTALVHEGLALRAASRRGSIDAAAPPPALLARVLSVARAFAELRVSPAGVEDNSLDSAAKKLAGHATDAIERALVKLLINGLGFFPSGAVVELSTGELGVVTRAAEQPNRFARPAVRVVYDARGSLLPVPRDMDLAAPAPDGSERSITRSIDADAPQARSIRTAMIRLTAGSAPASARPRVGPSHPPPSASPRRPDRVRTAPAPPEAERRIATPAPVAASWLGKPLSPSGSHPAVAPPRRPPQVDRAALLEKIQAEEKLASTQPPPADAMPETAVPRPPRLPRESSRPGPPTSSRRAPKPTPRHTIDPRVEPEDEETWTDDMPTIDPPPLDRSTLPESPGMTEPRRNASDSGDGWPDLDDLSLHDVLSPSPSPPYAGSRPPAHTNDMRTPTVDDVTWADDIPTVLPPPPGGPDAERDRILAAYLAEPAPPLQDLPPAASSSRRGGRALIPREEPDEDTFDSSAEEDRKPPRTRRPF